MELNEKEKARVIEVLEYDCTDLTPPSNAKLLEMLELNKSALKKLKIQWNLKK